MHITKGAASQQESGIEYLIATQCLVPFGSFYCTDLHTFHFIFPWKRVFNTSASEHYGVSSCYVFVCLYFLMDYFIENLLVKGH